MFIDEETGMSTKPPSPGTARRARRVAHRRWSVLIFGLLLAGLALAAHGVLADPTGISVPVVTGTFLLFSAAALKQLQARHDPETIRLMERRNEEAFATW